MDSVSFLRQLCIVIVLYQKKFEDTALFNLIGNIELLNVTVFIYDNSPDPQAINDSRFFYRHDPANSGISKAYNEGVKFAIDNHRQWVLFLDQDTTMDISFFRHTANFIADYGESVAFVPSLRDHQGIVSPFRWFWGKGKRMAPAAGKLLLKYFRFANSGLVVSCSAFTKTGGYVECIPLDFSDIAFGERLRLITDHFVVTDVSLSHPFSGSADMTRAEALARFRYFSIGAFGMGKTFGNTPLYAARVLLRALNLCLQHKTFSFLNIFIRHVPVR